MKKVLTILLAVSLCISSLYTVAFAEEEKSNEMIMNGECGIFAPKMLECFARVRERFNKLVQADH